MMEMSDGGSSELVVCPGKAFLWDEIHTNIINGISSADTFDSLTHSLNQLFNLSDIQLCGFLCTKEGIAMIKSNVVVENKTLRYVFVVSLSKLIIRGWICFHNNLDNEGFVHVESRAEARRLREDFIDMAVDLFRNFAFGCIGKAPGSDAGQTLDDDLDALNSYSEAITVLLDCYNNGKSPLNGWVDALLGVSGSGSSQIHQCSQSNSQQLRLNLTPLLRPTMNIIFSDPYLLISRCKLLPSYENQAVSVVNGFMQLLLAEIRDDSASSSSGVSESTHIASFFSILDLASTKSYQPMFATGRDVDLTRESRSGDQSLPVVQYVSQWVEHFLVYVLTDGAITPSEIQRAVSDIAALCQHRVMAPTREKTSTVLLRRIFYLLETDFSHSMDASYLQSCEADRGELLCLALLTLRYLPKPVSSAEDAHPSILFAHAKRLFLLVAHMPDEVARTRLLTELAILLVEDSLEPVFTREEQEEDEEGQDGGDLPHSAPPLRYDFCRSSLGRLLVDRQVVATVDASHTALLTAILRTVNNSLRLTASVLTANMPLSGDAATAPSVVAETAQFLDLEEAETGATQLGGDLRARLAGLASSGDNTRYTHEVCNHELFLSRNKLWRHTLSALAGHGASALSSAAQETAIGELCEHILRLMQTAVFIAKNCAESFLLWPVSGGLSDSLPSSLVTLLDTAASILLATGDHSASMTLRQVFTAHKYGKEVRRLSHQFAVQLDHLLQGLVSNSGSKSFVQMCVQPHALRLSTVLVRHAGAMVSVTNNNDLVQTLLSYLKVLLQQPSQRRRQHLAALQAKSDEGVLGGGRLFSDSSSLDGLAQLNESHPEHDSLGVAHRMHTLTLIAALATQFPGTGVAESCLKVVREIEKHFYVSSAAVTSAEILGVISTASVMREHIERTVRHIAALLPVAVTVDRLASSQAVVEAIQGVAQDCDRRLVYDKLLTLNASLLYEEDNNTAWSASIDNIPNTNNFNNGTIKASSTTNTNTASSSSSLMDLMGAASLATHSSSTALTTRPAQAHHLKGLDEAFGDNTDHSRSYGLFSADRSVFRALRDSHLSSADVFAVMDDVFHSHVHSATTKSEGSSSSSGGHTSSVEWSAAQSAVGERQWTQVSGSGDVLTVLCSTEVDPLSLSVTVHVRVHNSSGFKIPIFSLHLLLQSEGAALSSLGALFDSDSLFKATGSEYFLPDALVERAFVCAVQSFGHLHATVRVVYPDLSYDEDEDMFEIPAVEERGSGGSGVKKVRAKRSAFSSALSSGYFPGYSLDGSDRYAAVVSCWPLHVSVSALLVPYGAGALTSLQYWRRQSGEDVQSERRQCGVSEEVFQSLWGRLQGGGQISRAVKGRVALGSNSNNIFVSEGVAQNITSAVQAALSWSGAGGLHLLGMDSRVSVGVDAFDLKVFADSSSSDGSVAPYIAWALQTFWGDELACRLVVERDLVNGPSSTNSTATTSNLVSDVFAVSGQEADSVVSNAQWRGRLEIRSSSLNALRAVESDLTHFVCAISGGNVQVDGH